MKKAVFLIVGLIFILSFVSCGVSEYDSSSDGSSQVQTTAKPTPKSFTTMPYSSEDYETGDWKLDELISHFQELGFSDIETYVIYDTFDAEEAEIRSVVIEDISANSWSTSYKKIEKGEKIRSWLKIRINVINLIPTLTIDNCSDFADLVKTNNASPEKLDEFMMSHRGKYLEFDGTITDWYDEFWYISGVDFKVSVENNNTIFSWDCDNISDLGMTGEYHYEKYTAGMIYEGMSVHIITKIAYSQGSWHLEIESMQIIQ